MTKDNWIWMPHAGHFIGGRDCRFFLNTFVGNYIVSTVGEYWPDSQVRKITAKVRGIEIVGMGDYWDADYMKKIGFHELGLRRKYESMVFPAEPSKEKCCLFSAVHSFGELDFHGYNEAGAARDGHDELCNQWARKRPHKGDKK